MSEEDLYLLDDHILVLGYSDIVRAIFEDIDERESILLVSPDREVVQEFSDRGIKAVTAERDDEESLRNAGVERARAVIVATADDAADALTILTVRQLDPDVQILAVATNRENMAKLERAGATAVISPAVIAAQQLMQSTRGIDSEVGVDLLEGQNGDETETA